MAQFAHNLLVWFQNQFLAGTKAAKLGPERLVKQVLNISGRVHWRWRQMVKVVINDHHPWANAFLQRIKSGCGASLTARIRGLRLLITRGHSSPQQSEGYSGIFL